MVLRILDYFPRCFATHNHGKLTVNRHFAVYLINFDDITG